MPVSDDLDATLLTAAPLPITQRSQAEQRLTRQKTESNRADFNPHVAVRRAAKALVAAGPGELAAPLSLETQVSMASTLMGQFYREAQGKTSSGERMTASGRKQAAVAFGVVTDKLAMLQGRPRQLVTPAEAETKRPAVLELVRKLAGVRRQTPVESEQTPTGSNGG
jgi:hypothetical protein